MKVRKEVDDVAEPKGEPGRDKEASTSGKLSEEVLSYICEAQEVFKKNCRRNLVVNLRQPLPSCL